MTIERFRHSARVDARFVKALRFKLQLAESTARFWVGGANAGMEGRHILISRMLPRAHPSTYRSAA
jgi:hypothetical protein